MGNAGLRALVTGGAGWGTAVIPALERRGFSVVAEHCASSGGPVQLSEGPFQCYVQLPWSSPPGRAAAPTWMSDALVPRLELLAAVASRLAPRASVLLALDGSDTHNAGAATGLLEALALVVLEECGRPEACVSTVPAAELGRLRATSRVLVPASAG